MTAYAEGYGATGMAKPPNTSTDTDDVDWIEQSHNMSDSVNRE